MDKLKEDRQAFQALWNNRPWYREDPTDKDFAFEYFQEGLREAENRRAQSPWVRCSERLPTEADADCNGQVWVCANNGFVLRADWRGVARTSEDAWPYWKPTGLERPRPPEV